MRTLFVASARAIRRSKTLLAILLLGLCLAAALPMATRDVLAANKAANLPELKTDQGFLEEISKPTDLDINDRMAVFRFILSSLPSTVRVYPTENYYYFTFFHGGIEYAGNMRLAAVDRDKGILHFAYFEAANTSSSDGEMHYKPLAAGDGVKVEKKSALTYTVTFEKHTVKFELNDLTGMKPPAGLLHDNEKYLGPVFDESGIPFFLVFNKAQKIFHYVLNETVQIAEVFRPSSHTDRIVIGKRTGFALYRDHLIDRKILIGVHGGNVIVNNYYDGPFDQLPDNFIVGDSLKNAIEASDPSVAGKLDRFGYIKDTEGRYLIGPYLQYTSDTELAPFHTCANDRSLPRELYYRCFSVQGGG